MHFVVLIRGLFGKAINVSSNLKRGLYLGILSQMSAYILGRREY